MFIRNNSTLSLRPWSKHLRVISLAHTVPPFFSRVRRLHVNNVYLQRRQIVRRNPFRQQTKPSSGKEFPVAVAVSKISSIFRRRRRRRRWRGGSLYLKVSVRIGHSCSTGDERNSRGTGGERMYARSRMRTGRRKTRKESKEAPRLRTFNCVLILA